MGERRNRKSSWDLEKDMKQPSGMDERNTWTGKERHSRHGRYDEFYGPGTTAAPVSRDHSRWSSRELIEENPAPPMNGRSIKSRLGAPEGREIDGGNRFYRNSSPGFEETERRSYTHALENEQSYSHRYPGRGRSRSRSRSRSKSLSRAGERGRGGGWRRSRSKSRSDGSEKDRVRSRSPIGDYRRQSYGWSDRRSGPEKSSLVCRDFAAGNCRRGSQCRFLHPDNTIHREGDLSEDEIAGNRRHRLDHGHIAKHSYSRGQGFEPRNEISDPYNGEEQFHSKSRNAIPCKDFMKGNCRWGDTCRFSHKFSSDDSFDKGNRHSSFDKDIERQPYKNMRPLCKYFASGKCDRDNCRFSHDDPRPAAVEIRRSDVSGNHSPHDKSRNWDGPTWDDDTTRGVDTMKPTGWSETGVTHAINTGKAHSGWGHGLEPRITDVTENQYLHDKSNKWDDDTTRVVDTAKSSRWSENIVTNITSTDNTGKVDDRWRHGLESRRTDVMEKRSLHDKSHSGDRLPWDNATGVTGTVNSSGWSENIATNVTSTDDTGKGDNGWKHALESKHWAEPAESTYNPLNREREPSPPRGSSIYGGDTGTTGSIIKDNMLNQSEPFRMHQSQLTDGILNSQGHEAMQEDHVFSMNTSQKNTSPAPHVQEQRHGIVEFNRVNSFQSGILNKVASRDTTHPMLFSGQNLKQNGEGMYPGHSSDEPNSNLNELGNHTVAPPHQHDPRQYQKEAVQPPLMPELKASHSFPNIFTRDHPVQMTNSTFAAQEVDPVTNITVFPTQSVVNEHSQNYSGIQVPAPQATVMPSLSALSENIPYAGTVNTQPNTVTFPLDVLNRIRNGGDTSESQTVESNHQLQMERASSLSAAGLSNPGVEHPGSPKAKQQDVVANLEVDGANEITVEENKGIQEKKTVKTVDGHGKVEESSANKDEKVMRLFKNALIEFVKEILKPKWKEGRMSREVHKNIVKKTVEKITTTIHADQIPKVQDKTEQYFSSNKDKISKLVQAYVDRVQKTLPKKE